jgi:hypothetical protein
MRWIDRVGAAGAEDRLVRDAADVIGVERVLRHSADLVVVDALGHDHGQRGEYPCSR